MDLATEPQENLQPFDGSRQPSMPHFKTHRPILSGEVITITSQDPEVRPDWDLLTLQWALVGIWSGCAPLQGLGGNRRVWRRNESDTKETWVDKDEDEQDEGEVKREMGQDIKLGNDEDKVATEEGKYNGDANDK